MPLSSLQAEKGLSVFVFLAGFGRGLFGGFVGLRGLLGLEPRDFG